MNETWAVVPTSRNTSGGVYLVTVHVGTPLTWDWIPHQPNINGTVWTTADAEKLLTQLGYTRTAAWTREPWLDPTAASAPVQLATKEAA